MSDSQQKRNVPGVRIISSDPEIMEANARRAFKQKKWRTMNAMLRPAVKLKEGIKDMRVQFLAVLIINEDMKYGGFGHILEDFKHGRSLTDGDIPQGIEYRESPADEEPTDSTPEPRLQKDDTVKSKAAVVNKVNKIPTNNKRPKQQTPKRGRNERSPDRKKIKTKSEPQTPKNAKKSPKRKVSTRSASGRFARSPVCDVRVEVVPLEMQTEEDIPDSPSPEVYFSADESDTEVDSGVGAALALLDMQSPSLDVSTNSARPNRTAHGIDLPPQGRKCILVPQGRLIFNRFETSTEPARTPSEQPSLKAGETDLTTLENLDLMSELQEKSSSRSPVGQGSSLYISNSTEKRRNFPIIAQVTSVSEDGVEVTYLERTERPNHWVHALDDEEAKCRIVHDDIVKVLDAPGTFVSGSRYYADFGGQIHQ